MSSTLHSVIIFGRLWSLCSQHAFAPYRLNAGSWPFPIVSSPQAPFSSSGYSVQLFIDNYQQAPFCSSGYSVPTLCRNACERRSLCRPARDTASSVTLEISRLLTGSPPWFWSTADMCVDMCVDMWVDIYVYVCGLRATAKETISCSSPSRDHLEPAREPPARRQLKIFPAANRLRLCNHTAPVARERSGRGGKWTAVLSDARSMSP